MKSTFRVLAPEKRGAVWLAAMDIFDAVRLRRSIKPDKMSSKPVDRATVERLLEAANWAPSHGRTEPWRFIVFSGESRAALAEAVLSTMAREEEPKVSADDPRRDKVSKTFLTPPICMAIVCSTSPNPKIIPHEEIAATAMAVQNLQLVARAEGLATYWSSGEKAFHPRMAQFLGIAPPDQCLGFLFVGWPAIDWPEGERRPARDKVQWR